MTTSVADLNIPNKTLEDNFKLNDFQKDFTGLLELILSQSATVESVEFNGISSEMHIRYSNNLLKSFRFVKDGKKIVKILNLTDNKEIDISWI